MSFNARTLTETERQLSLNMTAASKERSSRLLRETTEVQEFMMARRRAGREFGSELREQVARGVGIDVEALNSRRKRDREAVERFAAKQQEEAGARAAQTNDLHNRHIRELLAREKALLDPASPGPIWEVRDIADFITIHPSEPTDSTSFGPANNIAHVYRNVAVIARDNFWHSDHYADSFTDVDWQFLWTPPRDGQLDAVSSLVLNGFAFARTDTVWLFPGSTSYFVAAKMSLTQRQQTVSTEVVDIVDVDLEDPATDCNGRVQSTIIDNEVILSLKQQFFVEANIPVGIDVNVFLSCITDAGAALLNFTNTGYGAIPNYNMNVPFVEFYMP